MLGVQCSSPLFLVLVKNMYYIKLVALGILLILFQVQNNSNLLLGWDNGTNKQLTANITAINFGVVLV